MCQIQRLGASADWTAARGKGYQNAMRTKKWVNKTTAKRDEDSRFTAKRDEDLLDLLVLEDEDQ